MAMGLTEQTAPLPDKKHRKMLFSLFKTRAYLF